jgi:RNA polymerase sigma-70 factor (ECF subfamily)
LGREEDAQLVQRCLAGDERAYRALVEQYQRRIYTIAFGILRNQEDAMDVTQDAFVKVHRNLEKFQGSSSFYTWLYRIVVNLCIDRKRRAKKAINVDYDDAISHQEQPHQVGPTLASVSIAGPAKELARKELREKMQLALDKLSADHREILVLREVEGMAYEEIADVLEIAKGTVMSRLFHARTQFKEAISRYLNQ